MKTVDKALNLLHHFSPHRPTWGLSELARAAGMDKATTLRMLNVLVGHAFLEQDQQTRRFNLGTAPLHLAKVREATFPLSSVVQPVMAQLTETLRETTHASVGVSSSMSLIAVQEPQRATRVYLDPSEPLPFHATAPGIVFLAFAADNMRESILENASYRKFTRGTPLTVDAVRERISAAAAMGYAISPETFEDEVIGIAAPFFDCTGSARGAIAVSTPSLRMTDCLKQNIVEGVVSGALEITQGIGAEASTDYLDAVASVLP